MSDIVYVKQKTNYRYYREYEIRIADFHVGMMRFPVNGFSGKGTVIYESPMLLTGREKIIEDVDEAVDFIVDCIFEEFNKTGMKQEIVRTLSDSFLEEDKAKQPLLILCPHCKKYFNFFSDKDCKLK